MVDPTPGFEFPKEAQDSIASSLKALVSTSDGRPPRIGSVRPPRTTQSSVVIPSSEAEPTRTVKVQQAAPAQIAEPEGISIDLPSRFQYYGFKDLYVKPFRVSHLGKVAKSHETGSMQTLAEVVSSVLSTPNGDTGLGFKLSMNDFNAVLFWLRLNSFSKKQMRVPWECNNPDHTHSVAAKERPAETLKNTSLYTSSDVQHRYLEEVPDPEHYHLMVDGYGRVDLRPETMGDTIDFMDHPSWEDPEFQFTARVASVLGMEHPDGTPYRLSEKIEVVENLPADAAAIALEFAELVDTFGVVETIQTKCNGCGASTELKIAVDALSFLSPAF